MQIQKYKELAKTYAKRLNDVRFVGQVLFVIIVLLISWSGIKTIQTNYGLQKQISELKQQNDVQRLKNENLELQNQYFNTDQYLELSARQNFGLALPGEKELIVPKEVAMANTIDLPSDKQETASDKLPGYQRNFQSWVNFFMGRRDLE